MKNREISAKILRTSTVDLCICRIVQGVWNMQSSAVIVLFPPAVCVQTCSILHFDCCLLSSSLPLLQYRIYQLDNGQGHWECGQANNMIFYFFVWCFLCFNTCIFTVFSITLLSSEFVVVLPLHPQALISTASSSRFYN